MSLHRQVVLVVVVLASLGGLPAHAQTTFTYLQGGNFEQVEFVDPLNGFISGDGGRVHYTLDGGLTWAEAVTVNDDPEAWGNVHGMFFRGEWDTPSFKGWACAANGVVLATDDTKGQKWIDANKNSRVMSSLALQPDPFGDCGTHPALLRDIFMVTDTFGYVAGDDAAYAVTFDGGANWTSLGLGIPFNCGNDPYDFYQIHFFEDSGAGFDAYDKGIIASEFGRLFRTDDAGLTWLQERIHFGTFPECAGGDIFPPLVGVPNLEVWEVAFDDPTDADTPMTAVGGVGMSNGYVFRRAGGWDLEACGAWSQQHDYKFVDPSDPSHKAVCGISTLYSVDVLDTVSNEMVVAGYAGHLFHHVDVDLPNFDTENCFACPPSTFCTSGETWVQEDTLAKDPLDPLVTLPPPFGNEAALLGGARVTDDVAVFAGHFGVITRYTQGAAQEVDQVGAQWALRLGDGQFMSSTAGVVVGQKGVVLVTEDGGLTWDAADVSWAVPTAADPTQGDVDWLLAVSFSGVGGKGVTVGTGGHVGLTADGGLTWTEPAIDPVPGYITLTDVSYVPGTSTVYACGSLGRVYVSTDDGETWEARRISQEGSDVINAVAFATALVGYVVADNHAVYQTTDGGNLWTLVDVPGGTGETLYDVVTWGTGAEAVVVGQNGSVFEKTGTSFVKQDFGGLVVTDHLLDVEQLSDGDILRICGMNGVVLFRDDGVWSRPRSRTTQELYTLSFLSADEGFAIGRRSLILEYEGP